MTAFYLKESSEKAMKNKLAAALSDFIGKDSNGDEVLHFYTHRWAVDWGIPVVQTPAVLDEEGNVTTPAVMETGFFANVMVLDDALDTRVLEAIDQKPNNPQRKFA